MEKKRSISEPAKYIWNTQTIRQSFIKSCENETKVALLILQTNVEASIRWQNQERCSKKEDMIFPDFLS